MKKILFVLIIYVVLITALLFVFTFSINRDNRSIVEFATGESKVVYSAGVDGSIVYYYETKEDLDKCSNLVIVPRYKVELIVNYKDHRKWIKP